MPYPMGPKLSIIVEVLRIRYSNTIVRLKLPFGKEKRTRLAGVQSWVSVMNRLSPVDSSPGLRHAPPWKCVIMYV